jgi:hypothetical protein
MSKKSTEFSPLMSIDYKTSSFAHATRKNLLDLSNAYALFACLPIVLAIMPDFQTILEDKDSHVSALAFQMGCP